MREGVEGELGEGVREVWSVREGKGGGGRGWVS